jgi:hypothetical protein
MNVVIASRVGGAAIQGSRTIARAAPLDCFVATLLAMTMVEGDRA